MFTNSNAIANVMPEVVIEILVWYQQTFVSGYNINKTQKFSPALLSKIWFQGKHCKWWWYQVYFYQLFIDSKDVIYARGSLLEFLQLWQLEFRQLWLCELADIYIIVLVWLAATCLCTATLDHDLMISIVLVKG